MGKLNVLAMTEWRAGRREEAVALYRQMDARSQEIIAGYTSAVSARAAGSNTSPIGGHPTLIDLHGMITGLGIAQRIIGLNYELAGNYSQAAAYYQKALDTMAVLTGVEVIAAKRLGFLYASGRGVPTNKAMAMALLSRVPPETYPEGNVYVELPKRGLLPRSPEDITPELLAELDRRLAQETQAMAQHYLQLYRQAHPYGTPRWQPTSLGICIGGGALPAFCG
jgi:hypothetical protein